jgi:hypothetical protein
VAEPDEDESDAVDPDEDEPDEDEPDVGDVVEVDAWAVVCPASAGS